MKSLNDYILTRLAQGKYFFSKQEVLSDLGLSVEQLRFQAYRLSKKKMLRRLSSDFFMIIPPEYYHLGSLPPHWIINAFMEHLGSQTYYIGLLSAASIYGATEQQPMVFQVITPKATKNIALPRVTIEFHISKYSDSALKTTITTPTGYAKVSKREQTVVDLVRFYKVSGYLSNVALIIQNLALECDPTIFAQVIARESNNAALQRLGYILEFTGHPRLADIVETELSKRTIEYIALRPDFPNKSGDQSPRWKLVLNDNLEIE